MIARLIPRRASGGTAGLLDAAQGGQAMIWVLAIMLFLTVLAAAGGIATMRAAAALSEALTGRATVQITLPDAAARERATAVTLAILRRSPAVLRAEAVPRAELARLLGPWLDGADGDAALPIPSLIDVQLAARADAAERLRARLRRDVPAARIDTHGDAMAPVAGLLASLTILAIVLVALMATATAAVVALATRAGLERHRPVIEVMHGLGATDGQVAQLFQRRIARDAGLGAAAGGLWAWLLVALLQRQLASSGSELLGSATLGESGWIALLLLPVVFVLFAALVARAAIVRSLDRVL